MRSNPFFLNALLPHGAAATDGLKQEERPRTQPCSYTRVTIPRDLRPFLHFSTNGGHSLAGGSSSSVWNNYISNCIWNGQVEADDQSRFNRTAMLSHDPFDISLRRWSPGTHTSETAGDRREPTPPSQTDSRGIE